MRFLSLFRRRRYRVFNATDGIWAHPDSMTKREAERFIHEFRERFTALGYYRTATGFRIPPSEIALEIEVNE